MRVFQNIWGMWRAFILFFTIFWSSIFFATLVLLLRPLAAFVDPERHFLHRIAVSWARTIVWFNPWWKFRIRGKDRIPPDDVPVVFVANHQSQSDIIAIFMMGAQFRWLSKDSVFRIPFIGWAMRAIGYVAVRRGDKSSHFQCMEDSKAHLRRGTSMVFFPEGTRSRDGTLAPFKMGAFKLASEAGVPVVPITLVGTHRLLPKGSWYPRGAEVDVVVHDWIESRGLSADELASRARKAVAGALPTAGRETRA